MEAGRELDALVAEKVMGYERRLDGLGQEYWREADKPRVRLVGTICDPQDLPLFAPSTDISAAWEVVSLLIEKGYYVDILYSAKAHVWSCLLDYGGYREADVIGDTAPYAICLAALKAVGIEED